MLFLGEVAPGAQFYLDGRAVSPRQESGMAAVDLSPGTGGESTLTVVFPTPAGGTRALFVAAQGGRRWAVLRHTTPAGPWVRRVFNGQAQVILQSTGSAGRATLRAAADGAVPATLDIDVF